jgi:aryl-alcohol dehydrogenase-like predicted oxidoreductase
VEYRKLGKSGLKVSVVGLGCNNFGMRIDKEQTAIVVSKAIEAGITLFDTADIYGGTKSEEFLGEALGARRQDVVIATKWAGPIGGSDPLKRGGSRRWIMLEVENSLRRLGTDWIDLYQYHFPDDDTPIDETLRALDDLVRQGKVRYVGSSNMAGWQVVEADWVARTQHLNPFVTAQNEYSLLNRKIEQGLVPALRKYGVGLLPYFPLGSGLLSGKYHRGEPPPEGTRIAAWGPRGQQLLTDQNFDIVERLTSWAEGKGHTILDLAFGWLISQDVVSSVIAGATEPEQIEANVAAGEWRLTGDELAEVNALLKGEGD